MSLPEMTHEARRVLYEAVLAFAYRITNESEDRPESADRAKVLDPEDGEAPEVQALRRSVREPAGGP